MIMSSSTWRPLLPKPTSDNAVPGDPRHSLPPSQPQPQKREMVKVACQSCRARKIKCDARRPACSPCLARRQTCEYETEADVDRYTSLKVKHSRLEKDYNDLLELFGMLRSRPKRDALSILDRVRSADDLSGALAVIKEGDLLMHGQAALRLTPTRVPPLVPESAESPLNVLHLLHPRGPQEAGCRPHHRSARPY